MVVFMTILYLTMVLIILNHFLILGKIKRVFMDEMNKKKYIP